MKTSRLNQLVMKGQIMKVRLLALISILVLLIAGCGTQLPQALETQKVPVRLAVLKGSSTYPTVNGKATYKVDNNGIREFQVEIEDAPHSIRGTTVNVFVGTTKAGSMTINSLGDARLRKVGSSAPVISSSSTPTIRVRTAAGVLVASGVMNQFKR
jgi:hypothetical protein